MSTELSGRELNAEIRRVVFRREVDKTRCGICGWPLYPATEQGCTAESCSERPLPRVRFDEPAPYSESIEAAMQVEARIRELGRAEEYIWQLIKANEGSKRFPNTVEQLYPLVFATAEQRCRAALFAIEGS